MKRILSLLIWLYLLSPWTQAATTVRSSSTATSASGTAPSITAPAGTTAGDLTLCVLSTNGLVTHTDNNGGTPFTKNLSEYQFSGSGTLTIWSRRIVGGDPGTYNWTISVDNRWTVHCITLQNPNATGVYDGSISPNGDGSSTLTTGTANGITTTQANSIHFVILTTDGPSNTISSTPAGYTCDQNGGDQSTALCRKVIATAGNTGAQSFSWGSASEYLSASFAILDQGAASSARIFGEILFRIH